MLERGRLLRLMSKCLPYHHALWSRFSLYQLLTLILGPPSQMQLGILQQEIAVWVGNSVTPWMFAQTKVHLTGVLFPRLLWRRHWRLKLQ